MSTLTRLRILMGMLVLGYLLLAGRLFQLSIIEGATYRRRAAERSMRNERLPARRGKILDRQGRILSVDEPGWDLYVRLSDLEGEGAIRRTARALGLRRKALLECVQQLEQRVGDTVEGAGAGGAEAHGRYFDLGGLELSPTEMAVLDLRLAAEEYWGFRLHGGGDEAWGLSVSVGELRGEGAKRRVLALALERTREDLEAALERKRAWIERRLDTKLGDRKNDQRRRSEVRRDLRAWSLPLFRDIPAELAREINLYPELYCGFQVEAKPVRRFPSGEVAVHVLGLVGRFDVLPEKVQDQLNESEPYVDGEFVGLRGVEKAFEARLHGQSGRQLVERTRRGGGKRLIDRQEPIDGEDIRLTLDLDLQRAAESALDATGRPGAVVAMDPRTGAVLAMASAPRYEPTSYYRHYDELIEIQPSMLENRAIFRLAQSPPGSAFKILVAVAGLETGAITPETAIECEPDFKPRCENHGSRGPMTVEDALSKSCNVFFARTAQKCRGDLHAWIWRFGFGQLTGLGLPREQACRRQVEIVRGRRHSLRNVGIGQEIEATPLQVARMTAVVANGGYRVTPYLDADAAPPARLHLGISPGTLAVVRRGLELVVDEGTARSRGLERWHAAGKTGSAQAGRDRTTGSVETHAWFTGYAPRDNPRILVTVLVEYAGHGGDVAAPVAAQVLDRFFQEGDR